MGSISVVTREMSPQDPADERNRKRGEPGESAEDVRIENGTRGDQGWQDDGNECQGRILEDEVPVGEKPPILGSGGSVEREQVYRGVAFLEEKLAVGRLPQHLVGPGQIKVLISVTNVVDAQGGDRIGERSPNGVVQEPFVEALPLFRGKLCTVVAHVKEGDHQDVRPEPENRARDG